MKLCIAIRQTALHLLLGALCILLNLPATAQPVVTFFHNDISGSPMVATDAAGNVVWKESYKPYGDKLRNEPASRNGKNNIGYAGSPFDASTGLSYMGARYYDPVIGRFMGIDPVGFQEDNIHSFNRYAYANNNPYRYIDRDGRQSTDILYNVWNRAFSNSAGPNANGAPGFELAKQGMIQGAVEGAILSAEVGMTVSSLGLGAGVGAAKVAVQETAKVGNLVATHGKTMSNKQLDKLVKDIRVNGVKEPLTVTSHEGKTYILDGHHRALAAPRAGVADVPVNRVQLPYGAYKSPADLTFTPGGY